MKKTISVIAVICMVALLAACAVHPPNYSLSGENAFLLKKFAGGKGRVVLGEGSRYNMECGAFKITPPNNASPDEVIVNAFNYEFSAADIYDAGAPPIALIVTDMHNSGMINRRWHTAIRLESTNGTVLSVSDDYEFVRSAAESGCTATAQAFIPAIQSLVGKAILDPKFGRLLAYRRENAAQAY
jgi:hypothetical protein